MVGFQVRLAGDSVFVMVIRLGVWLGSLGWLKEIRRGGKGVL